jgi:nucleoside-diphosphate-sugar epimerase
MTTCLITGATGFVGSHLAEACARRGWTVHALVRPASDAALLEQLGVRLFRGELADGKAVSAALEGVESVVHCAAKVGDWGPIDEYRKVNVEALRVLLDASAGRGLARFVHLSSLGVYAARHHHGTTEEEPLPEQHIDGYTQSKVEAEQLALGYYREKQLPVVVLRPGFIYGPRDRMVLPKLIENLRAGKVRYLGSGKQAMNTIAVGNLVEAIFLALEKPGAVGQVYNLTDGEYVSKRRFIEALADGVGVPRPPRFGVPLWLARVLAWWMEGRARRRQRPTPPRLTQARLKFLGLNLDFCIDKARRELGYEPRQKFDDAMSETVAWYRMHSAELVAKA